MSEVVLITEKAKTPDNEFFIDESYAMDLGLIAAPTSTGTLEKVTVCHGFIMTTTGKRVYLKDLFYSNHPALVKRSFTEIMFAGGYNSGRLNAVERLRYDDIIPTITHTNDLNQGKHYLAGTSDGRTGVFGGGSGTADLVQKIKFDDSIPSYIFSNRLSTNKRGLAGAASYGEALFGGGVTDVDEIDKIKFDDSAMILLTNGLQTGRHYCSSGSDRSQVCFAGGNSSAVGSLSSIEKIRYDDILPTIYLSNDLITSRTRLSGSSTEFEMIFSGDNNDSTTAPQFEKMRFDDSATTSVFSNTYSQPVHSATAQSNGYDTLLIAGGNLFSGTTTDTVESVKFDDSAHVIHTNLLSEPKYGLASAQGY